MKAVLRLLGLRRRRIEQDCRSRFWGNRDCGQSPDGLVSFGAVDPWPPHGHGCETTLPRLRAGGLL